MSATQFDKAGSLLTVKPQGRLDSLTAPALHTELQLHLEGIENIVMDFEKTEYISSGGLRLLLETEQTLEGRGGRLKLIHVNKYILEILDLMGLTDEMTIERD